MPLVGRRGELEAIGAALDARDGLRVLQIVGEAGVGKTVLLDHLADEAVGSRRPVLRARAGEAEASAPFGLLADALEDHLAGCDARELHRLGSDALAPLGSLVPVVASRVPAVEPVAPDIAGVRRAVIRILGSCGAAVVILDDLQWADEATLSILASLIRRPPHTPALLALAARPGPPEALYTAVLESTLRDPTVERLEPGPLTLAEASALLTLPPSSARLGELHRLTAGNPFALLQLARAPAPRRPPSSVDDIDVPAALVGSLSGELRSLGAPARDLMEVAAAIGDPLSLSVLQASAELDADGLDPPLAELTRAGLLHQPRRADTLRFRHPLVRQVVRELTGPTRRRALHRRAADVLAARSAPPAALAPHLEQAADPGDVQAAEVLARAAAEAGPVAPATAARWYEAALRLLPHEHPHAGPLGVVTAVALASAGRLEESRAAIAAARRALGEDMGPLGVRAAVFAALVEHLLGNHAGGEAMLLSSLARVPVSRPRTAAELLTGLAYGCLYVADFDGAQNWAGQAAVRAEAAADEPLAAVAVGARALADYSLGDVGAAATAVDTAAAAIDTFDDQALAENAESLVWVSWAEVGLERLPDAVRHLERGRSLARRRRLDVRSGLEAVRALAHLWVGEPRAAAECLEAALELPGAVGSGLLRSSVDSLDAWRLLQTGPVDAALAAARRAQEAAVATTSPLPVARGFLAEALLESGEPDAAADALGRSAHELPPVPLLHGRWLEILARAALAVEDRDGARKLAVRAADRVEAAGPLLGQTVEALRAQALVAAADGRSTEAHALADRAVANAVSAGRKVEAERSRVLRAKLSGDERLAVADLRAACAGLAAAGAMRHHDEAALALRRRGARVSRPAPPAVGVLSTREREVATLVAQGLTNRQIAERLYLSVRTVDRHLARTFDKLGVSSRAAVASAMTREIG